MGLPERNHRFPAVVFDLGGVLLDWNPRHLYLKLLGGDGQAVERFLTTIGFEAWNQEMDRGRPFAEAVADLTARFPEHADLIEAYDRRWEESLAGPIEGSVELLEELDRAGVELYGLSNWSGEKFRHVRPKYAFFQVFRDIVISGEVGANKPERKIFEVLLEKIGRPAQECVLIDDSERNILAARGLGFNTIRFQSPEQLRAELVRLGLVASHSDQNSRTNIP